MSKGKFRIQTVAEMTGVPASTLRTWEQRYGFPSPDRTASAYRMYSQDDIDRIGKVRELCERGLGPAEAVKQVFDAGELPPATAAEPTAEPLRVLPGDAATLVDALQGAIEGFEPERVESLVRSALLVGSHAEAFEQWVWPAWRRVRERWLAGSLGRHHERLAAELLGQAARDMIRLSRPKAPAPWAVIGCFADEDDPGPALGAALALHGRGIRAMFLGPRTRASVVRDAARAVSAAMVGLSVTEEVPARGARDLVDDYAAAIGERQWFVTGPGVQSVAAMVEGAGGEVAEHMADVRNLVG
ncbi:MAG: MerR family transcriptional regulator [Myxococcales bacterium]|nr:MerR family transcriptional regulator [Myxococcales bacterium]MCB9712350.1 MerR family transcriptional regulator [Myxococcales bacterium]